VLRHRIIASVSALEAWEYDPPMPIAFSASAFRPDAATPSLLVKVAYSCFTSRQVSVCFSAADRSVPLSHFPKSHWLSAFTVLAVHQTCQHSRLF